MSFTRIENFRREDFRQVGPDIELYDGVTSLRIDIAPDCIRCRERLAASLGIEDRIERPAEEFILEEGPKESWRSLSGPYGTVRARATHMNSPTRRPPPVSNRIKSSTSVSAVFQVLRIDLCYPMGRLIVKLSQNAVLDRTPSKQSKSACRNWAAVSSSLPIKRKCRCYADACSDFLSTSIQIKA